MESQAAGFIFIPVMLPFCVYTGAVAGASLVAILYGYGGNGLPVPTFRMIAIGFTVVLSGLVPSGILAASDASTLNKNIPIAVIPLVAICSGVASSWLASQLAFLLVTNFQRFP